jgi:hypothetical protein
MSGKIIFYNVEAEEQKNVKIWAFFDSKYVAMIAYLHRISNR